MAAGEIHIHALRARPRDIEAEREAMHRVIGVTMAESLRLALSKDEAAEALGVSPDFFERYVVPEIRSVRRGRRRLFPMHELIGWLWRAAEDPPARSMSECGRTSFDGVKVD